MGNDRWYSDGQLPETGWEQAALEFVQALVQRDFQAAHLMLSLPLRLVYPPRELRDAYDRIALEEQQPMGPAWVLSSIDEWPTKAPDIAGQAYVHIGGDNNEAITPMVRVAQGGFEIVGIEWGRP